MITKRLDEIPCLQEWCDRSPRFKKLYDECVAHGDTVTHYTEEEINDVIEGKVESAPGICGTFDDLIVNDVCSPFDAAQLLHEMFHGCDPEHSDGVAMEKRAYAQQGLFIEEMEALGIEFPPEAYPLDDAEIEEAYTDYYAEPPGTVGISMLRRQHDEVTEENDKQS